MKLTLTILGCGTSIGVPSINGNWGKCNPKNLKNYRSRCSLHILKGNNSIIVDTSPDLRIQCLKNNIRLIFLYGFYRLNPSSNYTYIICPLIIWNILLCIMLFV